MQLPLHVEVRGICNIETHETVGTEYHVLDADGKEVCCFPDDTHAARLVATAVNTHAGLLAALRELVERIERANGYDQRNDGLSNARAALAAANGNPS